MIYQPQEDSYLLQKAVKRLSKNKTVLDMGAATGIILKTALKNKARSIYASDIQTDVIKHLRKKYPKISTVRSDLFDNIKGKFDLITFNPPYLPEDKREDKESRVITTGGKKGDEIILRFLKQAPKHLNKSGTILIIVSSLTPHERINNLLKKLSLKKTIIDTKKLFMEEIGCWEITEG